MNKAIHSICISKWHPPCCKIARFSEPQLHIEDLMILKTLGYKCRFGWTRALAGFLLLLNLSGWTTASYGQTTLPIEISYKSLPFKMEVVITDAAKEYAEITNTALKLFLSKDYTKLDELAGGLRKSRACWPNGVWKLYNVYSALVPSKQSTDSSEWERRLGALQEWEDERPKSVSARVALANFLVSYAWHARGGGWANSVTDDGWEKFGERLKQAVLTLKESNNFGLQCPSGCSVLLLAGMGLNVDRQSFDEAFNRAVQLSPNYHYFYFRRAKYLLPRWGGQPGEWESDLKKSADSLGGEKGDELYAQIVWCMHEDVSFKNIFDENHLSWERVDKGFDVIEKDFPNSLAAKSERAHLAVLARDKVKARKYFGDTGGKIDLQHWASEKQFVQFVQWAYAP